MALVPSGDIRTCERAGSSVRTLNETFEATGAPGVVCAATGLANDRLSTAASAPPSRMFFASTFKTSEKGATGATPMERNLPKRWPRAMGQRT